MSLRIKLLDMTTNKEFIKEFKTEFALYKYRKQLRYSRKLIEMKGWEV